MRVLERIAQGEKEKVLVGPSISRVWQLIGSPGASFAVISASLSEFSDSENQKRHSELGEEILGLGCNYVEIISGHPRAGDSSSEHAFAEKRSFVVPEISKADATSLATEYSQPSILWKDRTTFALLDTREDVGTEEVIVESNTESDNLTFETESVRDAFSAAGGSGAELAFVAERAVHDFPTRMMYVDTEMLRGDWIVVL